MRIALVSLNQAWQDKKTNQKRCQACIEKAFTSNVDLIVFPEMTLTGFSMNIKLTSEKPLQSPTIKFFSQLAEKNSLAIAFGMVFEKLDKATNNLVVIDKIGNVISSYSKIHPFSFSGENNYFLGGDEIITCTISDATIGLTICYDLRFPEIFQALSKTCNLIITIANWPKKRVAHWLTLLRARAIENQVFFIGVNRTGIDGNNIEYEKSSVAFTPEGNEVKPVECFDEIDIIDIDIDEVKHYRLSFPVKKDRRINLYKEFYETEG